MTLPDPARYPSIVARMSQFQRGIASAPLISVAGRFVRNTNAADLKGYGTPPTVTLLYTGGYARNHTRYGRRRAFPLYHVSDGVTTAAQEVFGGSRTSVPTNAVPKETRLDLVVEISVHQVLDLSDDAVRKLVSVTEEELTEPTDLLAVDADGRPLAYELTQCIGEYAHERGCGAIKYPAARYAPGVNYAIFVDHLVSTGSWITTENPATGVRERLPEMTSAVTHVPVKTKGPSSGSFQRP